MTVSARLLLRAEHSAYGVIHLGWLALRHRVPAGSLGQFEQAPLLTSAHSNISEPCHTQSTLDHRPHHRSADSLATLEHILPCPSDIEIDCQTEKLQRSQRSAGLTSHAGRQTSQASRCLEEVDSPAITSHGPELWPWRPSPAWPAGAIDPDLHEQVVRLCKTAAPSGRHQGAACLRFRQHT